MDIKRIFPIGASLDYSPNEYIILGAIWVEPITIETQRDADRIAGIMRRMADWYGAYLVWEDSRDEY